MFDREMIPDPPTNLPDDLKKYIDFKVLEIVRYYRDYQEYVLKKMSNHEDLIYDLGDRIERAIILLFEQQKHKESSLSYLIQLIKENKAAITQLKKEIANNLNFR